MRFVKIHISGKSFLLPEAKSDAYEFPAYIEENILLLSEFIEKGNAAMKKFRTDPLTDHFSSLPDVSEFKARTGIIGVPFDMRDVDLYLATNKDAEIALEVSF